jgi:N-acetylglucosaminylphosphatidylinositol deacetylase
MELLTIGLVIILTFCLIFYGLIANAKRKEIQTARRVLLVTSHPDDECMFFGPTILSLTKNPAVSLFLLCMSNGDYRREGRTRKGELYQACKVLGIQEDNITVLSYTKLRDDPSLRWRDEIVSEVVLQTIESQDIDTVITFDRHGVSGHKNHCALYTAMAFLCLENRIPRTCRVFALRTVNFLRKYSSILDVPMSFLLTPSAAYVASPKRWLKLRRAMKEHKSQYVWYRKLYMLASRYILINTFDEISANLGRPHRD